MGVRPCSRSKLTRPADHRERGKGRMKVKGTEQRPIMKERLKLRVASAERNIPSVRREKHLMSRKWVAVGWKVIEKRIERSGGRKTLAMLKA